MKYLTYIIILFLGGIIAYLYFQPKDTTETDHLRLVLDSLSVLIVKDKLTIQNLIKDAEKTEKKELEYLKEADSLAEIISNLHVETDCPEIVENQSKEIVTLRDGLKECNKAKGIYVKTIGVCNEIIVKFEIKEITNQELTNAILKDSKKSKRNAFLLGSGSGAILVLALLLLL